MRRDRATSSPDAGHARRSRGSTARRGAERITALTLAFTVMGGAVLVETAVADPIEAKQAEARQVAAQLDALEMQLSSLDEDYNAAQLELAQLEKDIADAQARVDAAAADMDAARAQLRKFAVSSYMSSGDSSSLDAVMSGGDVASLDERRTYAEVTTGSRRDVLDQLESTRQRSDAEADDLAGARERAAAVEQRLADRRAEADAAVVEQERLSSRVTGELATLVQEENERRAAEEQARAQAEAQRQAAARAAAAPTTTAAATPQASAGQSTTATTRPTAPAVVKPVAPPPPVTGDVNGVIAAATSQIGVPYVWAGSTPAGGFDCSGFTMWAWSHGGKSLPHSAAAQYSMTRKVPMDQLQPGDLVFYGHPIHHVALYIGGGTIVHAPGRGRFVKYDSVNYWSELVGAGRL